MSSLTNKVKSRKEVRRYTLGTAERRNEIMKTLCRRRYETISNLASEFGVSERTIRRDIEALSLSEPIYTQTGRHCGGVYVVEGYSMERMYMSQIELDLLHKLLGLADQQASCILSAEEKKLLQSIILQYERPNNEN